MKKTFIVLYERPNMLLGQFKCGIEEDRHCGNKTVQPMYPIKVTEWLLSLCAVRNSENADMVFLYSEAFEMSRELFRK